MINLTRRSVLRASMGAAAAGTFARPYIANAQAKTAIFWHPQGFVPQEDESLHEFVNDYQKLSGNTIDLSIIPFAPLRQKIISAITSGVVPDLISATPPEVVPLQAWEDRLVDVTDVVETQKSKMIPIAAASAYCYNNVTKKRAYYGVPYEGSVVPFHIWRTLVEKAGLQGVGHPRQVGRLHRFLQAGAEEAAGTGHAAHLCHRLCGQHDRQRPDQHDRAIHVRLWRQEPCRQGRQIQRQGPAGTRSGDQGGGPAVEPLQGRLHPAELDQLERRRRQQRLPFEALRDGFRRHAVDRAGDALQAEGRVQRRHHRWRRRR